jgi:hypothetical protein
MEVGRENRDEIDGKQDARQGAKARNEQPQASRDLGCPGKEHQLKVQRDPRRHHGEVAVGMDPVVTPDEEQRERHGEPHASRPPFGGGDGEERQDQ